MPRRLVFDSTVVGNSGCGKRRFGSCSVCDTSIFFFFIFMPPVVRLWPRAWWQIERLILMEELNFVIGWKGNLLVVALVVLGSEREAARGR